MSNDEVIQAYNKKLTEIKDITDSNLISIRKKIEDLTIDLTIATKMEHKFEEHLIRSNLEASVEFLDMLEEYDFNIKK